MYGNINNGGGKDTNSDIYYDEESVDDNLWDRPPS